MLLKLDDSDDFRYSKFPKIFLENEEYKSMTSTAKIIYCILRDRMELSRKNKRTEDDGTIYLFFNQKDLADMLNVNRKTVNKAMQELQKRHLIVLKRQGMGRSNKIYINSLYQERKKLSIKKSKNVPSGRDILSHQDGEKCPSNKTGVIEPEYIEPENSNLSEPLAASLKGIVSAFNKSIRPVTPNDVKRLAQMADNYGKITVLKAVYEAAKYGANSPAYIQSILESWERRMGSTSRMDTVEDVKQQIVDPIRASNLEPGNFDEFIKSCMDGTD